MAAEASHWETHLTPHVEATRLRSVPSDTFGSRTAYQLKDQGLDELQDFNYQGKLLSELVKGEADNNI